MPSIIDRYLIREIGLTVLATLLVLLAIVLSHRLANYLSKAASGLLASDAIFLLLGLQAVYFLVLLMPLAFLLSVMLTLGRLYRDHEMIVLTACGYGPVQMYRAVFLLATPLSLMTAGLSFLLIPAIMELQFDVLAKARKEAEVSVFAPGTFREVLNGRHVVYIGALDERELRHVFIQSREPDGSLSITTGAQGRQETSEEGIRSIVLDHGYRYRGGHPWFNQRIGIEQFDRDREIGRAASHFAHQVDLDDLAGVSFIGNGVKNQNNGLARRYQVDIDF